MMSFDAKLGARFGGAATAIVVGLGVFGDLNVLNDDGGYVAKFEVQQASAAVGEGGLPEGALAFQKVIKYQKDWDKVGESVLKRGSEMEETEIQTIKIFLKQMANEYGDMELLSRGISGEKDKADAIKIAKNLRLTFREMDNALSDKNIKKVSEGYPTTRDKISEFLKYLQDVPDEL